MIIYIVSTLSYNKVMNPRISVNCSINHRSSPLAYWKYFCLSSRGITRNKLNIAVRFLNSRILRPLNIPTWIISMTTMTMSIARILWIGYCRIKNPNRIYYNLSITTTIYNCMCLMEYKYKCLHTRSRSIMKNKLLYADISSSCTFRPVKFLSL